MPCNRYRITWNIPQLGSSITCLTCQCWISLPYWRSRTDIHIWATQIRQLLHPALYVTALNLTVGRMAIPAIPGLFESSLPCLRLILYSGHGPTVAHCGLLWPTVAHCGSLWPTVAHCGSLAYCGLLGLTVDYCGLLWPTVTHCGPLWLIVFHCGSLRLTVAHRGSLWSTVAHCGSLPTDCLASVCPFNLYMCVCVCVCV
jgi:hypothetical protein